MRLGFLKSEEWFRIWVVCFGQSCVQKRFEKAAKLSLLATISIAVTILASWLIPDAGSILPDGWELMQFSTALCLLLLGVGFSLDPRQKKIHYEN